MDFILVRAENTVWNFYDEWTGEWVQKKAKNLLKRKANRDNEIEKPKYEGCYIKWLATVIITSMVLYIFFIPIL